MFNMLLKKLKNTVILRAENAISLDVLISSISYSNIDRKIEGIVSLFLCHITPSCKCSHLHKYKDVTRINLNSNGEIHIWNLLYNKKKPDVIIKDAILPF